MVKHCRVAFAHSAVLTWQTSILGSAPLAVGLAPLALHAGLGCYALWTAQSLWIGRALCLAVRKQAGNSAYPRVRARRTLVQTPNTFFFREDVLRADLLVH